MRIFFFILIAAAQSALAQSTDTTTFRAIPPKSNYRFGFFGLFGLSAASTSMPGIRSFFKENGIEPDMHLDPFVSVGAGVRLNRFKIAIQRAGALNFLGTTITERDENSSLVVRQQRASFQELTIGYDLVNSRNRRLYLNASYGSIQYEYGLYSQTQQTVQFRNLLQTTPSVSVPSLLLRLPYWDVNLELQEREKRRQGLEYSFRIGYRRGTERRSWESNAYQLVGGPMERISQFYVQGTYHFSQNYGNRNKP